MSARGFNRHWSAVLASNLADGFAAVVFPLLAVRLYDDPLATSAVQAVAMVPALLFALLAGALVDRRDRRRVMGLANLLRFVLCAGLVVLAVQGVITLPVVLAAVFVFGALETFYDSAAQAIVPSLVPSARLDSANAKLQSGELVAQNFVALPLAAVLFALAVPLPFVVSSAMFALSAILAFTLPLVAARATPADAHAATEEPFWLSSLAGARFVRGHRDLRGLIVVTVSIGIVLQFGQGALMFYLVRGLGIAEGAIGALTMLLAVGGIVGSLVAAKAATRYGRRRTMVSAMVALGVGFAVLGLVSPGLVGYGALGAALVVVSAAAGLWNVNSATVRQRLVPGHLLGRVGSLVRMLSYGLMPVAILAGGFVSRWDLRAPLLISGAITIVIAIAGRRILAFVDALPAGESAAEKAVADQAEVTKTEPAPA